MKTKGHNPLTLSITIPYVFMYKNPHISKCINSQSRRRNHNNRKDSENSIEKCIYKKKEEENCLKE